MSTQSQRSRSRNFDQTEKDVLMEQVEKHKELIQSKLSNTVTVLKKQKLWESITSEVNSVGLCNRSVKDVKNKWSNMHQKAKKENADLDFHRRQTGGGPPMKAMSLTSERVVSLFDTCPSFKGLRGIETTFAETDEEAAVQFLTTDSFSVSPTSSQFINEAVSAKGDCPTAANETTLATGECNELISGIKQARTETSQTPQLSTSKEEPCKGRKRKFKPEDVTQAQYEVLQLQKQKLIQQIKYFELMNKKLTKEMEYVSDSFF